MPIVHVYTLDGRDVGLREKNNPEDYRSFRRVRMGKESVRVLLYEVPKEI